MEPRLYYDFYSVHDCLWPWEVLQFRYDSWNYRPCTLSDSCASVLWLVSVIFHKLWKLGRFQTAKGTFKVAQRHWYKGRYRYLCKNSCLKISNNSFNLPVLRWLVCQFLPRRLGFRLSGPLLCLHMSKAACRAYTTRFSWLVQYRRFVVVHARSAFFSVSLCGFTTLCWIWWYGQKT